MKSHVLSRLAIFAAAFVINGLMLAGVDYLFNGKMHQPIPWVSLARAEGGAPRQQTDVPKAIVNAGVPNRH
jgi:hypothetical protein